MPTTEDNLDHMLDAARAHARVERQDLDGAIHDLIRATRRRAGHGRRRRIALVAAGSALSVGVTATAAATGLLSLPGWTPAKDGFTRVETSHSADRGTCLSAFRVDPWGSDPARTDEGTPEQQHEAVEEARRVLARFDFETVDVDAEIAHMPAADKQELPTSREELSGIAHTLAVTRAIDQHLRARGMVRVNVGNMGQCERP